MALELSYNQPVSVGQYLSAVCNPTPNALATLTIQNDSLTQALTVVINPGTTTADQTQTVTISANNPTPVVLTYNWGVSR